MSSIQSVLAAVHQSALAFHRESATMPATIAANYAIELADAEKWYGGVRIVAERFISESAIERAVDALRDVGVISPELADAFSPEDAIEPRVAELRRDLRSMKLYDTHTPTLARWVRGELNAVGHAVTPGRVLAAADAVGFRALQSVDSGFHYGGVGAVDAVAAMLALDVIPGAKVIQLGSGIGGPARQLAGQVSFCLPLHYTRILLTV